MKNLFIIACVLIIFSNPAIASKNKNYYIKKDVHNGMEFLCFSAKTCYNATPEVIKVNDKTYVGFGGYYYYDIGSYKYNASTNTYNVDIAVDRDPSGDLGYYNKCPYDEGNITHLIFSLTYSPNKRYYKAAYKGVISTKLIVEYEKVNPVKNYFKYLNVYYDNRPSLIDELQNWLDYFNKNRIKTFGKKYGVNYDIEIKYILKYYIFSKI
jgi:hypothetical protein